MVLPVPPHRPEEGRSPSVPQRRENAARVHQAWRLHYEDVRHSLMDGFYQSWDLHPAQLPSRYAAVYAFFLESSTTSCAPSIRGQSPSRKQLNGADSRWTNCWAGHSRESSPTAALPRRDQRRPGPPPAAGAPGSLSVIVGTLPAIALLNAGTVTSSRALNAAFAAVN
jgi:hypothetical protein